MSCVLRVEERVVDIFESREGRFFVPKYVVVLQFRSQFGAELATECALGRRFLDRFVVKIHEFLIARLGHRA